MKNEMIPYGHQDIDSDDVEAVIGALHNDLLTTGPLVNEFEKCLEKFTNAPTVVVSSGTAALHCAYKAIDLKPGDEIITPPITFVATQATAAQLGATIVFCDIDPETANIDPNKIAGLVNKNTKAIVAVDYAGHPADLKELREVADKFGLFLIEDAAHSLGSTYFDKKIGEIADLTTFSFFPTKNITTGEGGAVSSKNPHLLERARLFGRQGLIRNITNFKLTETGPWHQEVHEFGLNYRLPDILCALGINQLKKLEHLKKKRQDIWHNYSESFSKNNYIQIPAWKSYVDPVWHLYPIRVPIEIREKIFRKLQSLGIGVQVNYIPAYRHPVFGINETEFSKWRESELFYKSEISLPIHTKLKSEQIEYIIDKVNEVTLYFAESK
jgi:dTDP-4-amino-4,6-dideoxygalactose transaminase